MSMVRLSELELRAYLNFIPKPPAEDTARGSHRTAFTQIPFCSLRDGFSPQAARLKVLIFVFRVFLIARKEAEKPLTLVERSI